MLLLVKETQGHLAYTDSGSYNFTITTSRVKKEKQGTNKKQITNVRGEEGTGSSTKNHSVGQNPFMCCRLPSILYHQVTTERHCEQESQALWETLMVWSGAHIQILFGGCQHVLGRLNFFGPDWMSTGCSYS